MATIKDPNKLKKGDIILYSGSDWISRAINLFDNSEYSHASIYMGMENIMESTFSNGGVRINNLHEGAKKYDKLLIKRHASFNDLDMQLVLDQASLFNGSRYDVAQILQLALIGISRKLSFYDAIQFQILKKVLEVANKLSMHLFSNGDDKTVCSEFVYRCYNDVVHEDANIAESYKIKLEFEPTMLAGLRTRKDDPSLISNGSLISMYYGEITSESDQKVNQNLKNAGLLDSFMNLRDEEFIIEDLIVDSTNFRNSEPIKSEKANGELTEIIRQNDVAEIEALLNELDSKPTGLKGIQTMDVNVKSLLISDIKSNMDEFMIRTSSSGFRNVPHMEIGSDFFKGVPPEDQIKIKQDFIVQRKHFVTSQDLYGAINLFNIDDLES